MSELKPCPFCGSKAEYSYHDDFGNGGARCSNQSCFASHLVYREYEEWNNRPLEDALQAKLDDVTEAFNSTEQTINDLIKAGEKFRIRAEKSEDKVDALQAKLDIAVEALKHLSICGGPNCNHDPYQFADETLKKLEEIK